MKILSRALVALFAVTLALPAAAQKIFETGPANFSDHQAAGRNFVTILDFAGPTTIGAIGQEADLTGDGALRYFIFDATSGQLLYLSDAKAFVDDGVSFKISDPFVFTFLPGTSYSVGGYATVDADYGAIISGSTTQNGISSNLSNQNVAAAGPAFDNPILDTDRYCCDARIQLFAVAAVPEPASWALLIGGFGAAGGMLRRRRRVAGALAAA